MSDDLVFLRHHGTLEYRVCPFANDPVHVEHVRDAYECALPYLVEWCSLLESDEHWHMKHFSLHDKSEVCVQRSEGTSWSTMYMNLPRTADMFFSKEFESQFAAMFAKCSVVYDAEDLTLPCIWNAPKPFVNIISLLQCVLPGQLFFLSYTADGTVGHANYYPPHYWCASHIEEVLDVTGAWLGLDIDDAVDARITYSILRQYINFHRIIPIRGPVTDAEAIVHTHSVPFRWAPEMISAAMVELEHPLTPRTPPQRTPSPEDIEDGEYLDILSTPVLSSTASSPLDRDREASLPPFLAESDYESDGTFERECSVFIPGSPAASYYDPDSLYHILHTEAVETIAPTMSESNQVTVSDSTSPQEYSADRKLEPSEDPETAHIIHPSKRYRSTQERRFFTSDAYDAGLTTGASLSRRRRNRKRRFKIRKAKWHAAQHRETSMYHYPTQADKHKTSNRQRVIEPPLIDRMGGNSGRLLPE
ncbi:hypothetical protein DACRYDRAFT_104790 [Dacryopinax primogenitus]|uniref:Uncharacterized protein n=1 Tax=Dacryopinax primogenitus (strain DJM 731) TaxID=1858805 RepID=M5G3S2_DACPD|nr:uncharacterized protein DACRYDRAFT_104790 [Dacryopinax primogenitus]EJU04896.1 hypothetical protein DACRYDRAFT_104790 [Dacryopinax primogenitus]